MTDTPTINSDELCRLARITYRQLDHWLRSGVVSMPRQHPGSGRARAYPLDAAARVVEIAALIRAGFTLRAAVEIIDRPEAN